MSLNDQLPIDDQMQSSTKESKQTKDISDIQGIAAASILLSVILICLICYLVGSARHKQQNIEPKEENTTEIPIICKDSNGKPNNNCYGGWFYEGYTKTAEENANWASKHGWNYVLFSASIKTNKNKENLIQNIKEFRKKGIAFHIMTLEDPDFIDNHQNGIDLLKSFLNFFKENGTFPDGIHIDSEPHGMGFRVGSKEFNDAFHRWLNLLTKLRTQMNEFPSLLFSAAVAWWYGFQTDLGKMTDGHGQNIVNDERLHMMIPMIYDGAGGSTKRVQDKAQYYLQDRSNIAIGLDPQEYSSDAEMDKVWKEVSSEFSKNGTDVTSHLWGVCIYSNKRLRD